MSQDGCLSGREVAVAVGERCKDGYSLDACLSSRELVVAVGER